MIKEDIDHYLPPSKDREKELWQECVFVFDTSALLEFYYSPKKNQQEIFNGTFSKIKNRLWIPNHVKFEYLKNRETTLKKPIEEKYKKLEKENIFFIEKSIKEINTKLQDFINHTKKLETHPYLDEAIPLNFNESYKLFEQSFSEFKSKVNIEFKKREDEIIEFVTEDSVLNSFNEYFEIGKEYGFKKIMDIVKEGEIRYANNIPPGYKDQSKKEGTQKYGDLIIWKQILDFAEQKGKPIVFITNDVKEDWCYSYKRGNETRIERPKEDLVKEIRDLSGVDFCMYTLSQFLYIAREVLGTEVTDNVINQAMVVNTSKTALSIRYDGYYHTVANHFDERIEGYDEFHYHFKEDGSVEVYDLKEGGDNFQMGHYTFNDDFIVIKVEYPKTVLTLIGTISGDSINLNWTNTINFHGSEKGSFYPYN